MQSVTAPTLRSAAERSKDSSIQVATGKARSPMVERWARWTTR